MRTVAAIAATMVAAVVAQEVTKPNKRVDAKAEEAAIRKVLTDQQSAWNRGDIPGFMEGYVKSEKLRFASGGTFRFGWKTTLENYEKGYPNKDAMGELKFSDLQVQVLSTDWAEVFGRWKLKRGGEFADIEGLYTLLLKRTDAGWRVLHDHTSSRPKEEEKK